MVQKKQSLSYTKRSKKLIKLSQKEKLRNPLKVSANCEFLKHDYRYHNIKILLNILLLIISLVHIQTLEQEL